ncbi:MAG TPA: adenylate/guanylate cyclase domain-containing protein [Albitalea sp.]
MECGSDNPADAVCCLDCGAGLTRVCGTCGAENPARFRFCGNCGTPFDVARPPLDSVAWGRRLGDVPAPAAERRHLTVMFCDLVGSTELSLRLDPEELREVVRAYQAACAAEIERYDGYVAQYLGDGILAYFGYPVSHEDEGGRAARAGLGVVSAVAGLTGRLALPEGTMLAVRVGIHTGEVVVGEVGAGARREHLALGDAPNIAARLQSIAAPDTVVLSEETRRLIDPAFEVEDLGEPALKGIGTHGHVYRVVRERAPDVLADGRATEFVGREDEMAFLSARWAEATAQRGQVVVLVGDPGIGKSKLVREFIRTVGFTACNRLETRCLPYYRNTPFFPFTDLLQRNLGCDPEQPAEKRLHTITAMLEREGFPLEETVPLFADLLSVPLAGPYRPGPDSPALLRERTRAALIRLLLGSAAQMPLILIVEDLHWADPSTLELLDEIVPLVADTPLMVLFTARHEFALRWTGQEHVTHVAIRRLGDAQVHSLVRRIAGADALPAPIVDAIVARTDGVPLFVEELTRMVVESGGSPGDAAAQLAIPATLRDSLEARLDRLGPAKALAQLAATLGREFDYELIAAVADMPEERLREGLDALVRAGLLVDDGEPPDSQYAFKHALIQEAAYQSLLRSTRQAHHLRIADALLTHFPETARTQPELLAHHYTGAGLTGEAIEAWTRAGRVALQRSANAEAVAHLTQGLELVDHIPDALQRANAELDLLAMLAPAIVTTRGYGSDEARAAYARARELATRADRPRHVSQMLAGLFAYHFVRGDLEPAREIARDLSTLADEHPDEDGLRLVADAGLGIAGFATGELRSALRQFDRVIEGYDPARHGWMAVSFGQDFGVVGYAYSGYALGLTGRAREARSRAGLAIATAERIGHPHSLAMALAESGNLHQMLRDVAGTGHIAARLRDLAATQGFNHWELEAIHLLSWVAAMEGRFDEAFNLTAECAAAVKRLGTTLPQAYHQPAVIEILLATGRAGDALRAADELLDVLAQRHTRWLLEPEIHRLRGLALGESERIDEGEAALTVSLALADHRAAWLLGLRAATDLIETRLRAGRDIDAEAERLRERLAELGADESLADAERARTLLARLGATSIA